MTGPVVVTPQYCAVQGCSLPLWNGACQRHGDAASQAEVNARTSEQWAEINHRNSVMNAEYRSTHASGEGLRQRADRADREADAQPVMPAAPTPVQPATAPLYIQITFDPYAGQPIGWYLTNHSGATQALCSSDFDDLRSILSGFDIQFIVRAYYTQEDKPRYASIWTLAAPARYLGGITQPRWEVIEHTTHGDGLEVGDDGHAYFDREHHADTWREEDES